MNEETFKKKLISHKKIISSLGKKPEDEGLIIGASKTGKALSLYYSGFKCEKCGKTSKLQYHHLITRRAKQFLSKERYFTQRHYWANIVILCEVCHSLQHEWESAKILIEKGRYIAEDTFVKCKKMFERGV